MKSNLKIQIFSFGFHKSGIPDDPYGNGGGFVFDCRAIENPGREEKFRHQTGLDIEVIDFLESRLEAQEFLSYTNKLIQMMVEYYLQRNFTHLMLSFGCTGGRHRSVYCAEKTAAELVLQDLNVSVIHKDIYSKDISI